MLYVVYIVYNLCAYVLNQLLENSYSMHKHCGSRVSQESFLQWNWGSVDTIYSLMLNYQQIFNWFVDQV